MTPAEFRRSQTLQAPPRGIAPPLAAPWWLKKGDWDKAHKIVMDDDGRAAAWVHAHLHRVEGDGDNAAYWYRQARQPVASGSLEEEWEAIAAALLGAPPLLIFDESLNGLDPVAAWEFKRMLAEGATPAKIVES